MTASQTLPAKPPAAPQAAAPVDMSAARAASTVLWLSPTSNRGNAT